MIYDLWFLSPGACFPMIAAWCNVSSDKSTVLSLGTVASRLLYLSLTWEKLKIFHASLGPSSVSSAASLSLPLASQAASPHPSHLLHLLCICSLTPAAALTSQLVWVDLDLGADAPRWVCAVHLIPRTARGPGLCAKSLLCSVHTYLVGCVVLRFQVLWCCLYANTDRFASFYQQKLYRNSTFFFFLTGYLSDTGFLEITFHATQFLPLCNKCFCMPSTSPYSYQS